MDAPAARRSASGRAQLLNGLRRPSQIKQQEFIVSRFHHSGAHHLIDKVTTAASYY